MSAQGVLVASVAARLRELSDLGGCAVFDAPPVRGALPHAVIGEPVLEARDASGWSGREGRLVVTLADAGERPVRLRQLMGAVEEGLPGMAVDLAEGWRLAQVRLARSRLLRGGGDRWTATAEFVVRMWRVDS